jgi:hypothetical protein
MYATYILNGSPETASHGTNIIHAGGPGLKIFTHADFAAVKPIPMWDIKKFTKSTIISIKNVVNFLKYYKSVENCTHGKCVCVYVEGG